MPVKSHFSKWLHIETAKAAALTSKLSVQAKEKNIHNIRVAIKKLKAVYNGNGHAEPTFDKHFSTIAKLFYKAGKLRDARILQKKLQLLPAWSSESALHKRLELKIAAHKEHLHIMLANKKVIKKIYTELQRFEKEIIKPKLSKADQSIPMVATIEAGTGGWHELRKQLKKKIYQQEAVDASEKRSKKTKSSAEELQKLIGEWHDWMILKRWISRNKAFIPAAEFSLLNEQSIMELQKLERLIKTSAEEALPPSFARFH